jgi:hypothetical protein
MTISTDDVRRRLGGTEPSEHELAVPDMAISEMGG